MSNNNKIGGLAQFLSAATISSAQESAKAENIVKIDIGKLVPDPFNEYEITDVDSLAGMIASNNFHLEAIEVRPMDDGRYMIISGHRRRAAWEMLLNNGETDQREVPCIVRHFEDVHIRVDNDGVTEDRLITAEQQANIALILANRGQRKEKTIEVELWEIQQLEPYVKILYNQLGRPKGRGQFKTFFASVLNVNPSALQRKKNLLRLVPRARMALAEREINLSVAGEISGLSPIEQEKVLDDIMSGAMENTYKALVEYKQALNHELEDDEDDSGEEPAELKSNAFHPTFDEPEEPDEDDGDYGEEPGWDDAPQVSREPQEAAGGHTGEAEDLEKLERETGQTRLFDGGGNGKESADKSGSKADAIPDPPDTGNPQNDVHKWFMGIIAPEIAHLEKIKAHCVEMKEQLENSNEKGAALKAAKWDSCRSYVTIKILALQQTD